MKNHRSNIKKDPYSHEPESFRNNRCPQQESNLHLTNLFFHLNYKGKRAEHFSAHNIVIFTYNYIYNSYNMKVLKIS